MFGCGARSIRRKLLGRAMGIMGSAKAAAIAVAALVGGMLADRFGGPAVMAAGGVIGALCCIGYLGLPRVSLGSEPIYTARGCVRVLLDRPVLRRMVIAHGFYGLLSCWRALVNCAPSGTSGL